MTLSAQQARLQDDLRGLVAGDVRCDPVISQLYATDASDFQSRPLGVLWPRSTHDVAAAVAYCAEEKIPIHPRGSGTGLAGGAIGSGLILDFTRYMRRILRVNDDGSVVVQPGAVRERFNDILRRTTRRFFAPSISYLPMGTIGSIVSTDIAGPRWLRYGFPHEYVRAIEVVLSSGEVLHLKPTPLTEIPSSVSDLPLEGESRNDKNLWSQKIRREFPLPDRKGNQTVSRRALRLGYPLDSLYTDRSFHPERFFCGAEGSLGVITSLTLDTVERPSCTVSAILLFDSLDAAARSVEQILDFHPTSCELLDRRTINLLTNRDEEYRNYLPPDAESALLIEIDSDSAADLSNRISAMVRVVRSSDGAGQRHFFGSWSSIDEKQREMFLRLLRRSETAPFTAGPSFRTTSLLNDLWVPVPQLGDFLTQLQRKLRSLDLTCALGGHIGQGNIRIHPILPADQPLSSSFISSAESIFELAFHYGGGFISGSGAGVARSIFIPRFFPEAAQRNAKTKALFDPAGLMNPGRIVPVPGKIRSDSISSLAWSVPFRLSPQPGDLEYPQTGDFNDDGMADLDADLESPHTSPFPEEEKLLVSTEGTAGRDSIAPDQLTTQLKWNRSQIAPDVFRCNGCGVCRSRTPEIRSCPNFRHYPDEQASCRAKATVLRGILDGTLPLESLTEEDVRLLGEHCIMCHCCSIDCPSKVDVARIAFRIRSAQNAAHGIAISDKFLANLDRFLKIGSFMSHYSNYLIQGRFPRWLGEKLLGIAQGRKYPPLESVPFLTKSFRGKFDQEVELYQPKRVALFVDTFANYFDSELAQAAVKILEHNGISVLIPRGQVSSGHQAFALGHSDRALKCLQENVPLLADLIRQGYQVLTLEPLSSICLGHEYLWLQNDSEARLLAENVTDVLFYLKRLLDKNELATDFSPLPMSVAYHAPCRTFALAKKSFMEKTPAEELLALIPELKVRRLERGCCGLAGAIGLRKSNYAMSLRLGMHLFLALREPSFAYGTTECSFCRIQMEQGGGKEVFHPLKLLARSYGLTESRSQIAHLDQVLSER